MTTTTRTSKGMALEKCSRVISTEWPGEESEVKHCARWGINSRALRRWLFRLRNPTPTPRKKKCLAPTPRKFFLGVRFELRKTPRFFIERKRRLMRFPYGMKGARRSKKANTKKTSDFRAEIIKFSVNLANNSLLWVWNFQYVMRPKCYSAKILNSLRVI